HRGRRADVHRAAAAGFAERDVGLRARHLDRAGDPDAAAAYLAAARAEATALDTDAALALGEGGGRRARVMLRRGGGGRTGCCGRSGARRNRSAPTSAPATARRARSSARTRG